MNFAAHARPENCHSIPPGPEEGIHGPNPFLVVFSRYLTGKPCDGAGAVGL